MEKYEYKTFIYYMEGRMSKTVNTYDLESQLNFLGNEGWELVSSTSVEVGYGTTIGFVYTLKRKKA